MNAIAGYLADPGLVIMSIGALVGIAASVLGAFLVLRRDSMLSDAISHSVLFGIVVVYLITGTIGSPLHIAGAAAAGILTVWLSEMLMRSGLVKQDAAIGLVFPALFAVAVLLINVYARNVHLDADAVLLGEIAFSWLDVVSLAGLEVPRSLLTMAIITLINLAFVGLLFKELKLATFDRALAESLGFRPGLLAYALLTLVSVTAVGAFDAVGAILFIAFVIVPPSAAYLLTDRLGRLLAYGCIVSVVSAISGFYLAVAWDVSIGGMMATMTGVCLLLAFVASPKYGLLAQRWRSRQPLTEPPPASGRPSPHGR